MATTFSFTDAGGKKHTLNIRHNPYNVTWDYNLNTNIVDTYAGQVIQVLSVNIDNLVIEGQLGMEGPFGRKNVGSRATPRWIEKDITEQFSYNGTMVGLHGMNEFFRQYFAIASQGGDATIPNGGQYLQTPMTVNYDVNTHPSSRHWPQIIPVDFPSFRRANDNFAPMWKVTAHVWEADKSVEKAIQRKALERLAQNIGYQSPNKFSDPAFTTNTDAITATANLLEGFQKLLPTYTAEQLQHLIWSQASVPRMVDKTHTDNLPGEVG